MSCLMPAHRSQPGSWPSCWTLSPCHHFLIIKMGPVTCQLSEPLCVFPSTLWLSVFHTVTCSMCSLPLVILHGIRAGGSSPLSLWSWEPRQGQRRSPKERPSEFPGKGLVIQCLAMVFLEVVSACSGGVQFWETSAPALKSWHWAPGSVY